MIRLTDPKSALDLVIWLAAVGTCISGVELLARVRLFDEDSLLSWSVLSLRYRWSASGLVSNVLAFLFRQPVFITLLAVKVLLALTLMSGLDCIPRVWLSAGSFTLCLMQSLRMPYGQDGADQMYMIVYGAIGLADFAGIDSVAFYAVWFIAIQTSLAYLAAGLSKLIAPEWRSGVSLTGILGTLIYGRPKLASVFAMQPRVSQALSRCVICWECLFWSALVLPRPMLPLMLFGGLVFHATAAVTMGLNSFFWAFVATYPAIYYCANARYLAV